MQNSTKGITDSMQKLSSGLRISQAADDSAGLAISEKMRAQIRGLEQAERNIYDGISLIQTAEAGLGEIANPNLIRLRELAIQAANDTLSNADREVIQQEINQTIKTIDQIANNTEFNTIKLLNGTNPYATSNTVGNSSLDYSKVLKTPPVDENGLLTFGTNEGYPTTNADDDQRLVYGEGVTSWPSVRIDDESYFLRNSSTTNISKTVENEGVYKTIYTIPSKNVEVTQSVSIVKDKYEVKYTIRNNGSENQSIGFKYNFDTMLGGDDKAPFIVNGSKVENQTSYSGSDIPKDFIVYNEGSGTGANAEFQAHGIIKGEGILIPPDKFAIENYNGLPEWEFNSTNAQINDSVYSMWWNPRVISMGESYSVNTFYGQSVPPTIEIPTNSTEKGPFDLLLQVGANAHQQFKVQLSDVRTSELGIDQLTVLSHSSANQAIEIIDKAIQLVSSERTKYGSYQNALEHLKNNVSNYKLNLTAAESQLRDIDFSKEITKLTNKQVLLQSAQAMLTQANQSSQSILQFLK